MQWFTRMKVGMTRMAIMSVTWGAVCFLTQTIRSAKADYKQVPPYNSGCSAPSPNQYCGGKTYCGDGNPANYSQCQVNGGTTNQGDSCAGFVTQSSVQVGSCTLYTGYNPFANYNCTFCQVVPCTTGTCYANNTCGFDGTPGTPYYSYVNNACTN